MALFGLIGGVRTLREPKALWLGGDDLPRASPGMVGGAHPGIPIMAQRPLILFPGLGADGRPASQFALAQ